MMQLTYILAQRTACRMAMALTFLSAAGGWHGFPLAPSSIAAQSVSELISAGDRESVARRPSVALALYERAVKADPTQYAALWKASREAVDLGEFEPHVPTRTALYARAEGYAKRAVAANANDAEGHFQLSRAIGRTALAASARDRVKYAVSVRDAALRALALNTKHPGALHVLGVWNAEVMRLNGVARAFAKAFMGGQALSSASWAEAIRYMEQAVAVEPNRLVHHLDLARVYRDAERRNDARAAYQAALRAPLQDANDDRYRQSASDELAKLR